MARFLVLWTFGLTPLRPAMAVQLEAYLSGEPHNAGVRGTALIRAEVLQHSIRGKCKTNKGDPVDITFTITRGPSEVVVNARVVSTIRTQSHKSYDVELRDLGIVGDQHTDHMLFAYTGADRKADDGIYAANLVPEGRGRYSVEATAYGTPNTAIKNIKGFEDSGKYRPDDSKLNRWKGGQSVSKAPNALPQYEDEVDTDDSYVIKLKEFSIYQQCGSAQFLKKFDKVDYPPHQIRDLKILSAIPVGKTFHLQLSWTSLGAHLDVDTVSSIDLRATTDYGVLRGPEAVRLTDVVSGSLEPLPPFSTHNVTVSLPPSMLPEEGDFELFVGLRVANAQNVTSFSLMARMYLDMSQLSDSATAGTPVGNSVPTKATYTQGSTPAAPVKVSFTDKPSTTQAVTTEAPSTKVTKHQTVAFASPKQGANSTSPETKETDSDAEKQTLDVSLIVILTTVGALFVLGLLIVAFTVHKLSRPTAPHGTASEQGATTTTQESSSR